MSTATRQLAEFVAGAPSRAFGEAARGIARQSLLDTLAVTYAGVREPVVRLSADYAQTMRSPSGARGWLTGDAFLPEAAAQLNGVAAHALDYDDVTPAWRGHPGAVLWPALLAVASQRDVTFGELVDAYVLGFEVGAQIGACITAHHYAAGWHATATVGVIAAAAACARALALDARGASNALGLAVAQSAGVQSNFGSMAKPMQAGFAAAAAVRASLLARCGVEASGDSLAGIDGFSGLYGGTDELALSLPRAGESASIERCGIEVKQFPNCYAAHRAVEAALSLRDEGVLSAGPATHILIEGSPGAHTPLLPGMPATPNAARFSVEYGVAGALLDGAVRFDSFTDGALARADVRELVSITQVQETEELRAVRAARVTVTLAGGARRSALVTGLPGRFGEAAFMRRLVAKVTDCMAQAGIDEHSPALVESILDGADDSRLHPMSAPVFGAIFSALRRDDR